ncbi:MULTISPECIES: cache domain-containing protein [unclassified Moritella]|uniref:cache domain-containing protein n=1 Tax=unclassified Moritella TaxID=2637987 RepID=UPI001BA47C18|nr:MULTISPECIES: cache domain-containing protein [unclassified Moritella]QUM79248.1 cache domain-containing protein [Moritella sp. 5]QUM83433.1 cache domain-containing protein [Moritella sp. 28]QUM87739.1 cache domain-containing protein [Moritella sp. 36]
MLKKISLEKKLLLIAGSLSVLFIAFNINYFLYIRNNVIDQRRCALVPRINSISSIINDYYQLYLDGKLELLDAQSQAIKKIHQINKDNDNYIFVFRDDYLLLESINRSVLRNQNVKEIKDIKGVKLYQLLHTEAITRANGGYSHYYAYSKVSHEEQEKISYSEYFAPWGWIYGEGMYINDVDESILKMLTSY